MSPERIDSQPPERRPRPIGLMGRVRAYFLAGVLVTAPFAITVYLAWLFIDFVDSKVKVLLPAKYNPDTYLPFALPGIGLVVIFVFLTLVGSLTAGFLGRLTVRSGERIMARMPVIRSIYGAVKQIVETIVSQKSMAFRQVVLFEYPRPGVWAMGFVAGRPGRLVQDHIEDEVISILLPTTPNPTSGFLLFVPRADVEILDMTIEEGMKMVISVGIVAPDDTRVAGRKITPKFSTKRRVKVK